MKSKLIQNSVSELAIFAKIYEIRSGNKANMAYLKKAKVRAFYNNQNEIVGGYATSTVEQTPALRYFDFIKNIKNRVLQENGMKISDFVEITYTFFDKSTEPRQRIWILLWSLIEAYRSGKKYVLGGGILDKFNERISAVLSKVLYEGEVIVSGNLKKFSILYTEKKHLVADGLKALFKELFQLVLKQLQR